jgi:hypothetical protein
MRTTKHNERLADRRAEYSDRRENKNLLRLISELQFADPSLSLGDARHKAVRMRIAASIAAQKGGA